MAPDSRPPALPGWLPIVGCIVFALPLAAHAYAGTGSRYLGDDYCAGWVFRDYGLIGGQIWYYKTWNAVPTALLLMALTAPGGAQLAPALPALALASWLVAGTWCVRQISSWSRAPWSWPICVWIAEVVMYATLQDAPNVAQTVYQRVSMLSYVCPLIVLTAYAGWLMRAARRLETRWTDLATSTLLAMVLAAFGPVTAAVMTVATVLALVAALFERGDPRRAALARLMAAGCAGAVIALAIVALGPGNATRQAAFPHPPSLMTVGVWSVLYAGFMFCRPFVALIFPAIEAAVPYVMGETPQWLPNALAMKTSPVPLAIAMLIPATVSTAFRWPEGPPKRACWWIPIAGFVLVCACMAPSAYGTSSPPPPRALLIPQYLITSLAACWACAMVRTFAPRLLSALETRRVVAPAIVCCLLIVGPIANLPMIAATGSTIRMWARDWDETDRQIRLAQAGGTRDAMVSALDIVAGVGSISPDAQNWVNICAARYYGLRSITGIPASK